MKESTAVLSCGKCWKPLSENARFDPRGRVMVEEASPIDGSPLMVAHVLCRACAEAA